MDAKQGKESLGGIFNLLQNNVKKEDFDKIEAAVPGAQDAANNAATKAEGNDASKLLNSALGMFGGGKKNDGASSSGGGGLDSLPQLLTFLASSGITVQQITKFLPLVITFLNQNANVDVSSILGGSTTGASSSGGGANSSSSGSGSQGLANMLGGFMKK